MSWAGRDTCCGCGGCRPGGPALGLWRARDAAEMQAILESLPQWSWMTVQTTPLTEHPSDPALART